LQNAPGQLHVRPAAINLPSNRLATQKTVQTIQKFKGRRAHEIFLSSLLGIQNISPHPGNLL